MEGATCEVCWQGELALHQGALVCNTCGSLVQGFVEETQEYQGGTQTHFHRRSGRRGLQQERFTEREAPKLQEALHSYIECLQRLLQRQAYELLVRLRINPIIVQSLEHTWLAYVSHSHLLEEEFVRHLEERIKPAGAEVAGSSNAPRSASLVLGEALRKVLPPSLTLSLCFLACWHAREAVGPLDIIGWALDGSLPYLDLAARSKEMVDQVSDVLPLHFLDPQGVPTPTRVWDDAVSVAACVGLACPPLNVGLWLGRWAQELALPHAVTVVALQLFELYRKGCQQYRLQYRVLAHALVHAMALIVVAVKYLYGLDGRRRSVLHGVPAAPDWISWARVVLDNAPRPSSFPLDADEALDLPDPLFQMYMDYLHSHVFPCGSTPEELEEYRRLLTRLGKIGTSFATRPPVTQPQQPVAPTSPLPASCPHLQPSDQDLQGGQRGIPGWRAVASRSAADELFSRAWQRVHPSASPSTAGAGVQEAGPLPAGCYPFFGRAYGAGGLRLSAHLPLDYAAVLTVCAAYVGVAPNLLHSVVSELESGVICAETEVAFKADSMSQSRLETLISMGATARERRIVYEDALHRARTKQLDILPGFTEGLMRGKRL